MHKTLLSELTPFGHTQHSSRWKLSATRSLPNEMHIEAEAREALMSNRHKTHSFASRSFCYDP